MQLYTGKPPFADRAEAAVILGVIHGDRPQRPADMAEELWLLVRAAWAAEAGARPTAQHIVAAFPGAPPG
jgi:hypothetical protein